MKTAWSDFPWGGCGHVPVRAYPPTTPPVGVARNCGAGFIGPGRFGTWRVVMYSWQTDGETGQLYFPTHSAVAVCGGDLRPLGLFGLRTAARAAGRGAGRGKRTSDCGTARTRPNHMVAGTMWPELNALLALS